MSVSVTFYHNTSAPDVMDKALASLGTADCELKNPVDATTPTIYIAGSASIITANYVYIPMFSRFYFGHFETGHNGTMTFQCEKSDPISSFKGQIRQCPAVISRNPWHYDKYIYDEKLPIEARSVRGSFPFPNSGIFDGTNNSFILTTIG